jgi:hypothetical protein
MVTRPNGGASQEGSPRARDLQASRPRRNDGDRREAIQRLSEHHRQAHKPPLSTLTPLMEMDRARAFAQSSSDAASRSCGMTAPAFIPLLATSSASVLRGALNTNWWSSITGKAAAISPSTPIRSAISPSIAGLATKQLAGTTEFAAKQSRVDRTAHAELLDHARADATDLIPSYCVASGAAQVSGFHLNIVGFIEGQREFWVSEHGSRRTLLVVTPLAAS